MKSIAPDAPGVIAPGVRSLGKRMTSAALPTLRRCTRTCISALYWVTLVKAGLVTGAALTLIVRLIQH